jgi:hypothetical protein
MGILIVAGLALVAYGIAKRIGAPEAPPTATEERAPPSFGASELPLPPGARVVDMAATDGRLVLRVAAADGGQRLLVLDLASGALLGSIALTPAP